MTPEHFAELASIAYSEELFCTFEASFGLSFNQRTREKIATTLCTYAELVFVTQRNCPAERISQDEVVAALDGLFGVLEKQRRLAATDPMAAGIQLFQIESNSQASAMPKHRRDTYDRPDHGYPSLGGRIGWLERLLREIRDNLAAKPATSTRRGPKGKQIKRDFLFSELAAIFRSCGEEPLTYPQPTHPNRFGGNFYEFVDTLLAACPAPMRDYARTGLGDALTKWRRRGEPASTDFIQIPLFDSST